jgi:hypothetical protein
MNDTCETLKMLLCEGGEDYNLLSPEEKATGNIDRLAYTDDDIDVLRQFEGAAFGAKYFSLFTQETGKNAYAYLLLHAVIAIKECRKDYFTMHEGNTICCTPVA